MQFTFHDFVAFCCLVVLILILLVGTGIAR
jgi:hypothetical protein